MEIQPIVCSHCSAGVSDPFSIRLHDVVGAYFVCTFCGTMNIINSTQAKRDIIETIAKAPSISIATVDELEPALQSIRFDASTIVRDPRPIVVTSFVDQMGQHELLDSFAKPMVVMDVGFHTRHHRYNGEVFVVCITDITRIASTLVSVLNEHAKFKTIVIDEWRSVQDAVTKYISDVVSGRSLGPDDFAMRSEIIDWLLHILRIISENGIEVQIFHHNRYETWNVHRMSDKPKHTPAEDIPHQLMYSADTVDLMEHGQRTTLMSVSHEL